MNTIIRHLLVVTVLAGAGLAPARATDPAPAASGKVLLLQNERALEGDVERVADQYRVRRTTGETWVPAGQALCLCRTMQEAYERVRARANLGDADEHLRLANWCRQYGLRAEALAEVREAVRLRPGHEPSRHLLTNLEQAARQRPAPPAARPNEPEPRPDADVDLTADALGLFSTRVQPILMNACASCHATGRGGAFKLTRAYGVGTADRKAMRQNLAAVIGQLNARQFQASPLLTKSVSVHGAMAQAPLRNRQAPAYRTLEDWVGRTLANNPQLHERLSPPPAAPPPALPKPATPQAKADATGGEGSPPLPAGTQPAPAPAPPAPTFGAPHEPPDP
ncbi:MAG TPA: hypothetical protein VFE78_37505, partial [Gemmataceae bacterium]|nr:hypothetical protein [Gemmataceae bacterium]